ncbi:hypothetical protein [Campylobacter mucosalis]|uniref:Pentapeptide MXKDX repeat protein n=1 Tax=Campylobacter mucosalis CCUG 21559 TaxID=1032067 RepID=A0A6G5QH56_9BACT|nr:hypothetical protein [Campylobacter mucosalis]KEA46577.1 hypothetical protein CR66_01720 [Campylobacter mucosalis]QCD45025.1 hypothetical protein CMUC_1260 [Campylobacter mucosalis CCUG 21559]QKF62914.1 hypothetical protein CMCT_0774 [Campylobacter mucosalis]
MKKIVALVLGSLAFGGLCLAADMSKGDMMKKDETHMMKDKAKEDMMMKKDEMKSDMKEMKNEMKKGM